MAAPESPPVAPTGDTPTPTLVDTLGQHARLGGLFLASLYTAGVLIVNLDLAKHGLFNADLARPEYVMSGALWTLLAGLSAVAIPITAQQMKDVGSSRWRRALRWPLLLTAPLVTAMVLLGAVQFRPGGSWNKWFGIAVVAGNGVVLFTARGTARDFLRRRTLDFVSTIPAVLLAVGAYSAAVSPFVPRQFGGTQKPTVELVLKEPTLAGLVANWPTTGGRLGPVTLLFETATAFVVTVPGSTPSWSAWVPADAPAVAIDRGLVSAVIYHPPPKPGSDRE